MKRKIRLVNSLLMAGVLFLLLSNGCKKDEEVPAAPLFLGEGMSPDWSPDGNKIAFIAQNALYVMDRNGTNKKQLAPCYQSKPLWSPSGKYILFIGNMYQLCRINVDGSNLLQLTHDNFFPAVPSWSPDEKQIAFVYSGTLGELYLVNADGSNLHKVSGELTQVYANPELQWTADGKSILFLNGYDSERDIYLIEANGTNIRRIKNTTFYEEQAQLNGTVIYFLGSSPTAMGVYRMQLDGSALVEILPVRATFSCSPQGTRIACSTENGMSVMNVDGSNVKELNEKRQASELDWSSDGSRLAYVVYNNGANNIYSLTVAK